MNSHFFQNGKLHASLLLCASFIALAPNVMEAQGNLQTALTSQQLVTVTGVVTDAEGPVIGATVKEKGKPQNGTATDINGRFSIKVKPGAILEISYVGMTPQEVKAVAGKEMQINLQTNSAILDEVVVVGFGTQKKVNLTGAVGTLSAKEIKERPVSSAVAALQGLVPGLNIDVAGGSLETNPSINVRGGTTIGEGSSGSPLILIDGMEGDLYSINPQDIENISVLKDAAASSIYGSRAPFGVILVTTKSGSKDGKTQISYNNSFRWSSPINKKHMLNSEQFALLINDALTNTGGSPRFDDAYMQRIITWRNATPLRPGVRVTEDGKEVYAIEPRENGQWLGGFSTGADDVDAYDALYKDWNFSQEHNVSASGGNEKYNYYASGSFYGNDGLIKLGDEGKKRFTATGKINSRILSWMRFNLSMRFTREDYHRPADLGWGAYEGLGSKSWPILPLYDRNGHYLHNDGTSLASIADGGTDRSQNDNWYIQTGLSIEPIKNWVTDVNFNYRVNTYNRHWDSHTIKNYDINETPYIIHRNTSNVYEYNIKENYYNFSATSRYFFSLFNSHNFTVLGGMQAENLKQSWFDAQRSGILIDSKPVLGLTTGLGPDGKAVPPTVGGQNNEWSVVGFFGRLNYDYKGRYLLEGNIRVDGSSRFRKGHQWKSFPSVSIGWNIAQESFFEEFNTWCNLLKIRGSYGSLGNQNTDNWYYTYQTLSASPASGTWLQGSQKTNQAWAPGLVSESLTWEKIETYNIGLDWGFLNNRLIGSFDYYVRNTKDMVGASPALPNILGTGVPSTNNTDLRAEGWELSLEWRDRLACGLSYSAKVNLSDSRTKITRYPNNPTNYIYSYIAGRYTGEIWGYESIGIARSEEQMDAHLDALDRQYEIVNGHAPETPHAGQNHLGSNWQAGDMMYKDLNGDGRISKGSETIGDLGDKRVIGNNTPRYRFGIDLSASWKGFDMRVFFQGVMKRDYYQGGGYMFGWQGDLWGNFAAIEGVDDYYRDENTWSVKNEYAQPNINSYLPRLDGTKNTTTQTAYLQNASYIRLKNFQIGYTIPGKITKKAGISALRVYFSGENLFTLTHLIKRFDPETIGNWNGNGYPLSRTMSCGLSVTF